MFKVLIAEDESRLVAFIAKGLRNNGYTTTIAEDGEQALNLSASGEFDLLLLDLGLPIVDGMSVLQTLRQQQNLPIIIVVTALGDQSVRQAALAAGANDFIAKPFKFSELLEKMRSHLGEV
jgi:two-component system, OmpR family, copper resistance phosphate regulon response regulator CusR